MLCVTRTRAPAPRSRTDRSGEDRDVLRVGELTCPFAVLRCRPMDLDRHRAEELLEQRGGFRELGDQVPPDLRHGGLGDHETKKPKLAEDQDRVAGARARQQSGNQDVGIDTNG
jgi:hypothetical protein